ncbi:glycosyltransferase family 2 protein [Sedimentitalea todarodis]|uniref:Glycosyltransferase n=1 Tax=Sedimentitalea todarodis TaxID=1631240 RepID=A0ABU3VK33_9RHOB|nr:glycosyltransferase [Sedimentitalea todarodis]MDU9006552.1 glycosyltransferase [Sedimentitalea todarodis]
MTPTVSIVTPLFDGSAFLAEHIASVQAQQMGDYEHLIVDNLSADDGPAIARRAAESDPRIRLLEQRGSRCPAATRNAGIAAARGRFIAFLDCDDMWHPQKLSTQIAAMQRAGAAFSWTGYDIVDVAGHPLRRQSVPTEAGLGDLLDRRLVIGCLTAVYDREQLGRLPMPTDAAPEDFCLWADILTTCGARDLPVIGLPDALATYRVHADGASADKRRAARIYWAACRGHLGLSRRRAAWHFSQYALRSLAVRMRRER